MPCQKVFGLVIFFLGISIYVHGQSIRIRTPDTLRNPFQGIERLTISSKDSAILKFFQKSEVKRDWSDSPIFGKYRIGPQAGVYIPLQRKLINRFPGANPYYSIDFISTNPKGGVDFSIDLYNIKSLAQIPVAEELDRYNRYVLIGPSIGYEFWFKGNQSVRPFLKVDVEYLLGKLRIREENINTGLTPSYGTSILVGALFSNRFKLNLSYALVNSVKGYSMTGFTASLAYLFMPLRRKSGS